ncbi:Zinc finger, RING/FYVE/PHD-type [Penicillium roqueforti FM164]|uniref:Zinc finger, RING/FYVE/PHD-type n=1 Tax=Penicillium roqueforti (strain FM164) TaxID=1365484 RepID=W6Q9V2_PENRF|nr:Zinc finger, RING/FYVE/PHD-type [Penicillium roqueforti FM164]
MSSVSRSRPASGNTDRSPHGLRQDPPVRLSTNPEPVQPFNPFVTSTMLRTNSVPWHVSPAQPAILTSDLTLSDEFDDIHCVFCLAEDDDLANESVILRCQCKALSHLACAEEWLEKRTTGFGTSCCVCRNEGPLDALIRPIRVQSSDAETRHIHTATESSADRELATIRNSSPNDPSQSQPRQRSVGPQVGSVEQSVENGPPSLG